MRRPSPRDSRLDWRDPDMPCIRVAEDIETGKLSTELVPPEDVRIEARNDLKKPEFPRYGSDPSYWWSEEARYNKQEARLAKLPNFPIDCLDDCTTPDVCLIAGCKKGAGPCTESS